MLHQISTNCDKTCAQHGFFRRLIESLYLRTFYASFFMPPEEISTLYGVCRSLFPGIAPTTASTIAVCFGQGNMGKVKPCEQLTWDGLVNLVAEATDSDIEHAEYMALPKAERNALKKKDRFMLLGICRDGKRDALHLESRSAAALDIDENAGDLPERLNAAEANNRGVVPFAYAGHTTRSHTRDNPRLRIVVPFSRAVSPNEYPCCVRALQSRFGIAEIDQASVKPAQMMFLPVQNKGAEFLYWSWRGTSYIDPDILLTESGNVRDVPESDVKQMSAKAATVGAVAVVSAGDTEKTFFRKVNDAAMRKFTAWVPKIWPEAEPYHGGFRIPSSVLGRELEEALSITPEGIKDFGIHDMGDPHEGKRTAIDLVIEHVDSGDSGDANGPHDAHSAAFWLCAALGVAPESFGWMDSPYPYVGDKGQIFARLENVVVGLRKRGGGVPHIGYDEALADIVVNDGAARSLTDNDYSIWKIALERQGFNQIPSETMRSAVEVVARENTFDSLKEWANGLKWDNVGRVAEFAHTHLGVQRNAYTQAVSLYLWTALAGRAVEPGVKADYVPVLVGSEGTGKTQTVEALAPNPRFFASIDMQAKPDDLARKTRGVVVAEWAEMRGAKTRDEEAIKDFVTCCEENHTPKFKERNVRYLRRFIIIGTTNDTGVLPAYGAARRWLPLEIAANISVDAIKRDREQLWAEGVHLFKNFGILWRDAELTSQNVRDDFREEDPLRAPVITWLGQPASESATLDAAEAKTNGDTEFAISDIISALEAQRLRPVAQKLGLLLKSLSYVKFQKRQGPHWLRLWRKQ